MRRFVLACIAACLTIAAPAAAQAPRCDDLDPKVCLQPFPSNLFTKSNPATDTGIQLDFPITAMPRNVAGKPIDPTEWNRNDGFSPGSLITTFVPGLDLEATRAPSITDPGRSRSKSSPIMVIDTTTLKRHLVWAEMDVQAPPEDRNLIIRPAQNFREGRTYVVVLRNLKREDGGEIPAGAAFRAYRDGPAPDRRLDDVFKVLAKKKVGVKRDRSLFLAWDFTVASKDNLSERMLHIRNDAFRQLGDTDLDNWSTDGRPPAFTVDRVEENPSAEIARRITGHFDVPCYLDTPGCEAGGSMRYIPGSTTPVQIPANTYRAKFVCNLPRAALAEAGRGSLYGHGLFGSTGEVNQGQLRAFANEENISFCATHWAGMSCEQVPPLEPKQDAWQAYLQAQARLDRFNCDLPNVVAAIADLSRFNTMIDRVQHGILSFLYLGRLMAHPDGFGKHAAFRFGTGPAEHPAFNPGRVEYDGNSQGGIIGGALAAFMVDGDRVVLGVPGMNYSTLLQRSTDFGRGTDDECPPERGLDLPSYACLVYKSYPSTADRQVLFGLMQILWDRGEADGYAWHMTKDPYADTPPHEVMFHVAFGDHQVTNWAAAVEARTVGARLRTPALDESDRGEDADARYFAAIPAIRSYPYTGSAIVIWDSGPIRGTRCDGQPDADPSKTTLFGTAAPLIPALPHLDGCPGVNTPQEDDLRPEWGGQDPHEEPRNTRAARVQKSEFMKRGGTVIDVCGGNPCYSRNWK